MSATFSDLGVSPDLVARLRARGITSPFPIQEAILPDALAGRDVCGRAPTGSGKTLAFGLAIAGRATSSLPRRPGALVLVPTRELAAQVQRELAALSKKGDRGVIAVYGGTGYGPTRQALARGVDILVACPGRLEDLVAQGAVDLSGARMVVLDEADRMADMGFLPAVRRLVDLTPQDRQILLFSATLGREVETLVRRYQSDPCRHDVAADTSESLDVSHQFLNTPREQRVQLTADLVRKHGRALIFCRTRHGADRLTRQLNAGGVKAAAIHGDRSQGQRERALASFSQGVTRALVATDVAARGIHVEDLPCVVHYDPPANHTDYLHRSGRTGRAGKSGVVISLVSDEQQQANRELRLSLGFLSEPEKKHTTASIPVHGKSQAGKSQDRGRGKSRPRGPRRRQAVAR